MRSLKTFIIQNGINCALIFGVRLNNKILFRIASSFQLFVISLHFVEKVKLQLLEGNLAIR